jgi:hypothetical protein
MIYLSGTWSTWLEGQSEGYPIGPIITPDIGGGIYLKGTSRPWAADNACFAKGDRFDLPAYLAWLKKIPNDLRSRCLFATAPDVVGDWNATWERSRDVLPKLQKLGYAAAVVVQDGCLASEMDWQAIDAVFVGGSTKWKLSQDAENVCCAARQRQKWVHMGRVNSFRRLQASVDFGCQSVDGTFLAFGPEKNLPKVLRWLDMLERNPSLLSVRWK